MRILAVLFSASALMAQPPTALDSAPFHMELRLVEPHVYQQRELIRVEIDSSGLPFTPNQPPSERWQFAGFLVTPALDCGSVEKPCYQRNGFSWPDVQVEYGTHTSKTTLNAFIPELPPGQYKVSALARKIVLTSRGPLSSTYGYADPSASFTSNAVDLVVQAVTPQWISQTIASTTAVLRKSTEGEAPRIAAQQLALLDNPAAWRATLDVLPMQENILLAGLGSTSQPGPLCDLMQLRIPAPEQAVSGYYLSTMREMCMRANLPPVPVAPTSVRQSIVAVRVSATPLPATAVAPISPEMQAYFEKQRLYREELTNRSVEVLAASLGQKQAEPKMIALTALLEHVRQLQYNRPPGATPLWAASLTREFLRVLPALEPNGRRNLLGLYTTTIPTPEVAQMIESLLDEWKPGDYYEAPRETLASLYRVDPKRAQKRILGELTKEKTWLDVPMLDLLPAKDVPPMDEELIAALAKDQLPGGWNPNLRMAALSKFATPEALPRMRRIYESQQAPCQPEFVAYFLRVDAAYADRILHAAATPSCMTQYFTRTSALIMHPVLEAFIASHLLDGPVYVKNAAARALGKYGSETAEKPLWEAFRYFHAYFDGKGPELAKNGEGVALEVETRSAIARAPNWLATEEDLRTLQSLCISERCLYEAQQDLEVWRQSLHIEINEDGPGIRGSVAQYRAIETMEALEAKLAQFPAGTTFRLSTPGPNRDVSIARMQQIAARKGFTIVLQ